MLKPIIILGCGGHARVVADVCRAAGRIVGGFLDNKTARRALVGGIAVVGGDELLDDRRFVTEHEFVVAIGDQRARRRLSNVVRERGGTLATVIHPSAVVAPDVRIGAGTVLVAGSIINPGAVLGDFVIINTGATIDHDNVLKDGVQVCPGANLAGTVTCGEDAFIGTGAIIIPGRTIGARAVIGAGSVVTSDIPDDVTAVGCPARVVKGSGAP